MTTNVYRTSRKPTLTEKEVLLNPTIEIKADDGYRRKIKWHLNKAPSLHTANKPNDKIIIHHIDHFTYNQKYAPVKARGESIDSFSHLVKDLNRKLAELWETNSHIIIDLTDVYDNTTTKMYIKSNSSLKSNPMKASHSKKVNDNYTRMTGDVKALGKNFNKLI